MDKQKILVGSKQRRLLVSWVDHFQLVQFVDEPVLPLASPEHHAPCPVIQDTGAVRPSRLGTLPLGGDLLPGGRTAPAAAAAVRLVALLGSRGLQEKHVGLA